MRLTTPFTALLVCIALLFQNTLEAQCTIKGATIKPYGQGCTKFGSARAELYGGYYPATCTIRLSLEAHHGYSNTFLVGKALVFGMAPANVPMPWIGSPSCTLLVSPMGLFVWPSAALKLMLDLKLPPNIGLGTVYVQGVAVYYTKGVARTDFQLTRGLAVSIW